MMCTYVESYVLPDDVVNVQVAGDWGHLGGAHQVGLIGLVSVGLEAICGTVDGNLRGKEGRSERGTEQELCEH